MCELAFKVTHDRCDFYFFKDGTMSTMSHETLTSYRGTWFYKDGELRGQNYVNVPYKFSDKLRDAYLEWMSSQVKEVIYGG